MGRDACGREHGKQGSQRKRGIYLISIKGGGGVGLCGPDNNLYCMMSLVV